MKITIFRVSKPGTTVCPMEDWVDPEVLPLIANAFGGGTEVDAFHAEEALYEAVAAIYDGRDVEANENLPEGFVWIRFDEPEEGSIGIIVRGVVPLDDTEAVEALREVFTPQVASKPQEEEKADGPASITWQETIVGKDTSVYIAKLEGSTKCYDGKITRHFNHNASGFYFQAWTAGPGYGEFTEHTTIEEAKRIVEIRLRRKGQ